MNADPGPRTLLRPPQFGLRTLLGAVTACAVLFALAQWLPPVVVVGLGFLGLTIVGHVAGNALGTRLRGYEEQPPRAPRRQVPGRNDRQAAAAAPATNLSERRTLGWSIAIGTGTGVVLGGIGGGLWTLYASRGPVDWANVAVGVVAFATLGGLATFAAVGFLRVLFGAMWQALQAYEREGSKAKLD